jgi:TldD protein
MTAVAADSRLTLATDQLLTPAGLTQTDLDTALAELMAHRLDLGELYFQHTRTESWAMEDGKVKDGAFSVDRGVGVRAVTGDKTGFAYADSIELPALLEAARAARGIARRGGGSQPALALSAQSRVAAQARFAAINPIPGLDERAKVELLRRVEDVARRADPRVVEVNVRLSCNSDTSLVVSSDGVMAADIRPLIRLDVSVIVAHNARRERGSYGGGGRHSLDWLLQNDRCLEFPREAVRMALVNLEAIDAPAGAMPVVLGPGWPAVLLHEAVGHGLEGDFNRKGTSAYANRIGEQVASRCCTVVDDGTLADRRGSLTVDDEGTPTQRTVLIENGILKGYLQDKLNARLMNTSSTGNARRQSYAHMPMPRMTNTFMLAGKSDPAEIIASVKKGIYAVNFGGGQVDITSGRFVFSSTEAYMIENGKVTQPLRGATLIGNGPDVMNKVSMVGTDLALDNGVGVCGKDGQSVPVGVGQPTLLIDEVTVGGTAV